MNKSPRFPAIVLLLLLLSMLVSPGADAMSIAALTPSTAAPGDVISVSGHEFGRSQGRKYVTMSRIVHRRPISYRMEAVAWSDTEVRVRIPPGIPSDDYLIVMYDGRPTKYSNNMRLTVLRPGEVVTTTRYRSDDQYERAAAADRSLYENTEESRQKGSGERVADTQKTAGSPKGGMFIARTVPDVASSGSPIRIYGNGFGAARDGKVVAINGHDVVHTMEVLKWSDTYIRAVIPTGINEGKYLVLVYYDDTYRSSSNSKTVFVQSEAAKNPTKPLAKKPPARDTTR